MKYKRLIVFSLMIVLLVIICLCFPKKVNNKIQKGKKEDPKTYKKEELSDSRETEEISIYLKIYTCLRKRNWYYMV